MNNKALKKDEVKEPKGLGRGGLKFLILVYMLWIIVANP